MAVQHGGGVDFEPAFVHAGQFEGEFLGGALPFDALDQLGQFGETEGFQNSAATNVDAQTEQPLERLVDELDAPVAVEDQDAFDHAVEDGLLLGVGAGKFARVAFLAGGQLAAKLANLAPEGGSVSGGSARACRW
jgi:hypothetical protein